MIRVTINRRIPSANAFNNKRGMGAQHAYCKDRDIWLWHLQAALRKRDPMPPCHVRIEVHSYRNRILDDANLRGGCKALIDNLQRLGYLHDDAPRFFHADYVQHQVPRMDERTVLVIHPPTEIQELPCKSKRSRSTKSPATEPPTTSTSKASP